MKNLLLCSTLAFALAGCGAGLHGAQVAATGTVAAAARAGGLAPGSVIYGVSPQLFGEHPLADVTGKLDFLKDLGVDALWLAPIMATDDPSQISYQTTDFKAVRPDFGTMADLKGLVKGAHQRGIKVLLDIAPNHTSDGHPFFKDAQAKGPGSAYWDYYVRDKAGKPQHYFDWSHLFNLNYDNPAVQQTITDAFTFWLKQADVDGYRVDAAWGPQQRTPGFWPQLTRAVRASKPNAFLLAEGSAHDPAFVKAGFDAAYDWTTELGHASWEHVFDDPAQAGDRLRAAMAGRETPPERIGRFLDNNDTGKRFITQHGDAVAKVAAALLLTLPGYPMVYNGDEVGAEFEPYEDPQPLSFADPKHLRNLYKTLVGARHDVDALRKGSFAEVATGAPGVYAFFRDAGKGDTALVVLNFGGATSVTLTLPAGIATTPLVDLLGAPTPDAAGGKLTLAMNATRPLILIPQATAKLHRS